MTPRMLDILNNGAGLEVVVTYLRAGDIPKVYAGRLRGPPDRARVVIENNKGGRRIVSLDRIQSVRLQVHSPASRSGPPPLQSQRTQGVENAD